MVNQRICVYFFQAFLTLARDIKAKIDKKLVRTSRKHTCYKADGYTLWISVQFLLCSHVLQEGNNPQGSSQGVKITDQPKKSSFFRCTLLWGDRSVGTHHRLNCVPHWTELDRAQGPSFLIFTSPLSSSSLSTYCAYLEEETKTNLYHSLGLPVFPRRLNRTTAASATSRIWFTSSQLLVRSRVWTWFLRFCLLSVLFKAVPWSFRLCQFHI